MQSISTPVGNTMNHGSISREGNQFGQSIQEAAPVNQLPDSSAEFSSHQTVSSRDIKPDTALLSKLHHFAPGEDKARLDLITKDIGYQEKFDRLMEGKLKSYSYLLSDTCNTLYWGLMNEKLTEKEFMEHYHFLMLNLFFFSKQCKGILPEGEYNLARNVREMTLHDLDSSNDYPGGKFLMRLLLKNTSDQRHQHKIFEFFLTDNVKSLLVENKPEYFMKNKGSNDFQQNHYLFWIHFLNLYVPGVWLSKDKDKIAIGSFSLLSRVIEAGISDPVKIKPGFGAGDWDALKLMRLEEQHPVALWHPLISNSLVQPDGYWAGTLSHLHDFYHLRIINNLGKEKRQLFLWLDTEIACRRIAFYERVLSDKKTVEDERFITIFSTLKYGGDSNVQGWDNSCISELLKLEVNVRSFVDQEIRQDLKVPFGLRTLLYRGWDVLYNLNFREKLEINLFIFHAIMSDNTELVNQVLGISIRQYPQVRDTIAKCNKTSGNSDELIKNYLCIHPLAGFKWLMDKWIIDLSQLDVSGPRK